MQSDISTGVRQLVGEMDVKFTRWHIYRTAMGDWHLKGEQSTQVCEITADGFVEAIKKALQWRALPLVPRPQERLNRDGFRVTKISGDSRRGKWLVSYLGNDRGRFFTKKEAEAFADRQTEFSRAAADGWEISYGWARGKSEGVDFRWAR